MCRGTGKLGALLAVALSCLFTLVVAAALVFPGPAGAQQPGDHRAWLEGVKQEAVARGVSQATLAAAFDGWQPVPRVIELDRRQPEYTQSFWSYLDRAVSPERIRRGREMLAVHKKLLAGIERRYGVQGRFLVAFWGLETNFGANTGGFPVIDALATLAHDQRRPDFFRAQLLDALEILESGDIALERMTGSWAGAMGQVQFMPETFRRHAVDGDGDGKRDIWFSLRDAFSSAANFLKAMGWRGDQTWGREVRLPAGFDWSQADLDVRKPVIEWQRLGVRTAEGHALPPVGFEASIILPGGHKGPAFMVYDNFRATLGWNRSLFYAVAVGHLADRISGKGPLLTPPRPDDRPLSRQEVAEMQRLLASHGLQVGEPDGVVGAQTRSALRAFQQQHDLPPDGYPTAWLLERLRRSRAQ